jgi:glycosyltransferase involved in cell wall biosynthesis
MSEFNPLVSIIIPLYNGEKYIKETIDSVLEQTYSNLEILIVDDCSSDNSVNTVQGIEDERIKLIHQEKNQGLNKNIQKGVELATGEYICVLGHDDLMVKEKIDKQVKYLIENNLDLVYASNFVFFEKENKKIPQDRKAFAELLIKSKEELMYFIYTGSSQVPLPMSQSALFKSFVLKELNYLRAIIELDDWPILVKSFENYKCGFINEPMFYWRIHENNLHKKYWFNLGISIRSLVEVVPEKYRITCLANNLMYFGDYFTNEQKYFEAFKFYLISSILDFKHNREKLINKLKFSIKTLTKGQLKKILGKK